MHWLVSITVTKVGDPVSQEFEATVRLHIYLCVGGG